MRRIFIIILISLSLNSFSQTNGIKGNLFNEEAKPISFATATLLNPSDSTLEFYAITDKNGFFEIKSIKEGNYLLQLAYLGYETFYKNITIPAEKSDLGIIVLKQADNDIDEVEVVADHVPISIKKDTIEYNASAFKTKPDAVVEDLLKKLPGVKVDRAGNIKALGVDVTKLLVDGKEFFGNDTKVATKNLPANAVDRVQVFDKKSDESEFTGIDDGTRDKTINLKLKEDKKNSLFGDITGGYGTNERYKANAKLYRFKNNLQIAGLGMINNINQFGFSFSDYLNFNGGIMSIMSGHGSGKIQISDDNSFPVNFGQPVTGEFTSGAGGFNFSHSKNKNNRIFFSYLANGSDKYLEQLTTTKSFTEENNNLQIDSLKENIFNEVHRINFGYRNRIDSSQNLILNGGINFSKGNSISLTDKIGMTNDILINTQNYSSNDMIKQLNGNVYVSYMKKFNKNRSVLKLSTNAIYSQSIDNNESDHYIKYITDDISEKNTQFQDNTTDKLNYILSAYLTQKTKNIFYLVPEMNYGNNTENLQRVQGSLLYDDVEDLNFSFIKEYKYLKPGINLKRNTEKSQFAVGLKTEFAVMKSSLTDEDDTKQKYLYFLPNFFYEYEYKTGRRISFKYNTYTESPSGDQLLPIMNNLNPSSVFYGNPDLKPEYIHNINLYWWIFDQFSFTTLMTGINFNYTTDKINWSRTVNEYLEQESSLINVNRDFNASGNIDFSTPVKKLGIKVNINLEERFNQGINYVNDIENEITSFNHKLSLSIENRKKKKIDILTGIGANFQDVNYSIQNALNRQYFDIYWYGEFRYDPSNKWHFEFTADVTNYNDKSFKESIQVPLLNAEISYKFLKHNRATLLINAYDILNQNTGIRRFSELNYLREIKSNIIGRYIMLSLKFRINKFESNSSGINVKINSRH